MSVILLIPKYKISMNICVYLFVLWAPTTCLILFSIHLLICCCSSSLVLFIWKKKRRCRARVLLLVHIFIFHVFCKVFCVLRFRNSLNPFIYVIDGPLRRVDSKWTLWGWMEYEKKKIVSNSKCWVYSDNVDSLLYILSNIYYSYLFLFSLFIHSYTCVWNTVYVHSLSLPYLN